MDELQYAGQRRTNPRRDHLINPTSSGNHQATPAEIMLQRIQRMGKDWSGYNLRSCFSQLMYVSAVLWPYK